MSGACINLLSQMVTGCKLPVARIQKKARQDVSCRAFGASVRLGRYVIVLKVERTLLTGSFSWLSLPNFIYLKAERGFANLVCEKAFAVAEGNKGPTNHGHTDSPK